jgi:UDP-glucose 4-epimerase
LWETALASKTVLVTGVARFIGMQVCERLLARGEKVAGVDSLTPYYDPALKRARLNYLKQHSVFEFYESDLADPKATETVFDNVRPDRVVHLAAQRGVRASIDNPIACRAGNRCRYFSTAARCRIVSVDAAGHGSRPICRLVPRLSRCCLNKMWAMAS